MISVSNIEELYSAVNDSANDGATIVLAPGTYVLTANGPGGLPRPNGGRLELRRDMSLIGTVGDRDAVKIDSSQLPVASLRVPFSPPVPSPNRTGPIRIGLGKNTVEWLTVIGNPLAAGGIDTDLGDSTPAKIRVAHVVSGGSLRGLDVRNVGSAMAGRKLEAEIEDNDLSSAGPQPGEPPRQAIRFYNFIGATGGEVHAKMSGNRLHGSLNGCLCGNNKTNSSIIEVRSNGDRFEENETSGCWIEGEFVDGAGTFNGASSTFEAHGCKFQNNGGYGILAEGADVRNATDVAFDNKAFVNLFGCTASNNALGDFKAYGAKADPPVGIAGTSNKVTIERHEGSTQIQVDATDSEPLEPAHTNTVTVASSLYYRNFRPREITESLGISTGWFTVEQKASPGPYVGLGTMDLDGIPLQTTFRDPAAGSALYSHFATLKSSDFGNPIHLPKKSQLRATFRYLETQRQPDLFTNPTPTAPGGDHGDEFEVAIVLKSAYSWVERGETKHPPDVEFKMQTTDKTTSGRGVRLFVDRSDSSGWGPEEGDFLPQAAFNSLYDVSHPIFTLNALINTGVLNSTAYLELGGNRYETVRPFNIPFGFIEAGLTEIRVRMSSSKGDGLIVAASLYEFEIVG